MKRAGGQLRHGHLGLWQTFLAVPQDALPTPFLGKELPIFSCHKSPRVGGRAREKRFWKLYNKDLLSNLKFTSIPDPKERATEGTDTKTETCMEFKPRTCFWKFLVLHNGPMDVVGSQNQFRIW